MKLMSWPMPELRMNRSQPAIACRSASSFSPLPARLPCIISTLGKRVLSIAVTRSSSFIAHSTTFTSGRCSSMTRRVPGVWPMSPMFTVSQADCSRMVLGLPLAPKTEPPSAAVMEAMKWRRVCMTSGIGFEKLQSIHDDKAICADIAQSDRCFDAAIQLDMANGSKGLSG